VSNVLVVGGAGYIGSHACVALRDAGHEVVVYDNFSTGHREAVLGGVLVDGDIRDGEKLKEAFRNYRVAVVMHFAALISVAESVSNPIAYYETNVEGTLSLLSAMVDVGVKVMVFSSTAAVYGNPDYSPMLEDHPTRPLNAYGESKLAIERAFPHYERAYGLKISKLRYFNASGADPKGRLGEAHDPETHLIPRAFNAVLGGPPLEIFGENYSTPDGTCLRDFVHVTDLADAHVRVLSRLQDGGDSGVYNVGTGSAYSVREVIQMVEKVTGHEVPTIISPRRIGDPSSLLAASDRIQNQLGWTPIHSDLQEIVESAWQWHQTGWHVSATGDTG
jgi:UDP-glucose 4-epimerase